jgi:uncharacterized protein YidB (DUF937 family)
MGLLDSLAGAVLGKVLGGGQQQALVEGVLGMLGKGGGQGGQAGGLAGLVDLFSQKGLGDQISSWVGTGQNLPVSANQIQHALGGDAIQQLAAKAGISPEQTSSGLAHFLPQLIDQLTPDGKMPAGGTLEQGLAALKGKLFG